MSFIDTTNELSSLPSTDLHTAGLNSSTIDALSPDDKISVRGVSYVKATALMSPGRVLNTSWVWKHGVELVGMKDKRRHWQCNICKAIYGKYRTDRIRDHLRNKHRVTKEGLVGGVSVLEQQQRGSTYGSLFARVGFQQFHTAIIRWIVCMHIPISNFDNTYFRDFLSTTSSSVLAMLPLDGDTIGSWILREFHAKKEEIRQSLHESKSLIHFSFDLWKSPNSLAMLGLVSHYVDETGTNRTVLLGLRRLKGPHSGENMAQLVIELIEEYELIDKIGYFVLDNATSNDTCVAAVLARLRPELNPIHRRLRCLGHVINLTAKAFLYGEEKEAFEAQIGIQQALENETKELQLWRKRGAVGKLHNIVLFIRRTPQRREAFEDIIQLDSAFIEDFRALQLVADNATRWNSLYSMIQHALLLKNSIDLFMMRNQDSIHGSAGGEDLEIRALKHDILTPDEWLSLSEMVDILKPFHDLTLRFQGYAETGKKGALWEYLPSLEFLLMHIEKAKQSYEALSSNDNYSTSERQHMKTCLSNAWIQLDEYYARLDKSPAYYAACVINPKMKWAWLKEYWKDRPNWISHGEKALNALWAADYKGRDIHGSKDVDMHLNKRVREPDDFDRFITVSEDSTTERSDSLEAYIREKPVELYKSGLLAWWHSKEAAYPDLTRLAYDMHSIPAMSAECERIFGSTKLLISDRQNGLKDDVIEASEVLKSWIDQVNCMSYTLLFYCYRNSTNMAAI